MSQRLLTGDVASFWLFLKGGHCDAYAYGDQNLPSVDSFGNLIAFQGPPELATLGISSLHIPRKYHCYDVTLFAEATQWKKV